MTTSTMPSLPRSSVLDKPVVLVDVDGVLANFVGRVLSLLDDHGIGTGHSPYQYEDIHHLSLDKVLPERAMERVNAWRGHGNIPKQLSWYEGGRVAVHYMKSFADVHALTSPWSKSPNWHSTRVDWLAACFAEEEVIFCNSRKKYLVRGDVLIEDNPDIINKWRQKNPNGVGLLVSHPWNKDAIFDGYRCADVLEASEMAHHLLRKNGRL